MIVRNPKLKTAPVPPLDEMKEAALDAFVAGAPDAPGLKIPAGGNGHGSRNTMNFSMHVPFSLLEDMDRLAAQYRMKRSAVLSLAVSQILEAGMELHRDNAAVPDPSKEAKKRVGVTMSKALVAKLDQRAQELGQTRNGLVNMAICQAVGKGLTVPKGR